MAKISTDMVKPFNGEGDVIAWLAKVELVASLSGVTKVEDFLPLWLDPIGSRLAAEATEEACPPDECHPCNPWRSLNRPQMCGHRCILLCLQRRHLPVCPPPSSGGR